MKIAMIGSRGLGTSYGGIERVLDAVCPELVALGHDVDVFAATSATDSNLRGLKVVKVPSIAGKHTETISRSILSLALALGQYDIIHFHAIGPGILSAATRLFRQPTVVTIHGLDQRRDKWGPIAKSCLSMAENTIVRCADRITVVSEELRRYFVERHDVRTSFIPNGLPVVTPVPPGPLLKALGLAGRRYVFFASRLTPEKGCHDLIEAHKRVSEDATLVIAGKALQPDYEANLATLAGPNVLFVGHRSGADLQELYSNATLFVLPSYLEGMSMALLEAMAYDIPTIVSDIPENIRVVGNAAIRFQARDVSGLAGALAEALARPLDAAPVTPEWPTWSKVARSYSDVYDRVMARPLPAPGQLYERKLR
ncbi:glycosyltransferase family 4 protein (plasmid) [Rhizobium grahamii]|uniref:Glycosyltransferase family 4 protein n=1 Tax=Rhizobium grahamii TaxID=1120045 RepID=A0A5Q0CC10_9HYPH|nr:MULTISPECIES: glycosyltransferase family 4 protein [Rhizobium]QFY63418.1 glycosyltransferase family 4 protein [Rhizobium grahamii]QRM51817.1 glycosyltransferase family 4 protein [Rhizobium sp. BG6]